MAEATRKATEEQKAFSKRNWADEDDDGQDEDDVEIGGATVAQVGSQQPI